MKVLIRPISSHEDPAAGFSFTKAKPAKNLDFSIKPRHKPAIHFNDSTPPAGHISTETSSRGHPAVTSKVTDPDHHVAKAPCKRTPAPKQANIPVAVLAVPFPNAEYTPSREPEYPTPQPSAAPTRQDVQSARTLLNDTALCGDDTLSEQHVQEMDGVYQQYNPDPSHSKAYQEPAPFDRVLHEVANNRQSSQHSHHKLSTKPARAPQITSQTAPHAPSKVVKSRRKRPAAGPNNKGIPHAPIAQIPYDEEVLLTYFTVKYKEGIQERYRSQAAQLAKDVELQQLKEVSNELYTQVQDLEQRRNETEGQLSKFKAAKPGWESKIKKLSDYLKGLSNDHNRLRDDSRDLRERQISVNKDREALTENLRGVRQYAEDQQIESKQLVVEAHHELKLLGQTVQHQRSELHGKHELLLAEQERSSRLEEHISKFSDGHGLLVGLLSGHRDTITSKINELLGKAENFQAGVPAESQNYLRPMMEQCITLLQNLQNSETIRPDDLDTLKSCMRGYFDGYAAPLMQQYSHRYILTPE